MFIKQISTFLENKPGRLAEVTGFLAEAGINIHALTIADTTDFGILRFIVEEPDKAAECLRSHGMAVKTNDVIAVALTHHVGALSEVLKALEQAGVGIEYIYAFTSRFIGHDAIVILKLADQDKVLPKLKDCAIKIIDAEVIQKPNA